MFENLGWWEIALIAFLALFIFGPDRLPRVIRDAGRFIRNVRKMARSASDDLRGQLGPDFDVDDLHPKRFVRKHLLSEDDEDDLRRPFQLDLDDDDDDDRAASAASGIGAARGIGADGVTQDDVPERSGDRRAAVRPRIDPDTT